MIEKIKEVDLKKLVVTFLLVNFIIAPLILTIVNRIIYPIAGAIGFFGGVLRLVAWLINVGVSIVMFFFFCLTAYRVVTYLISKDNKKEGE